MPRARRRCSIPRHESLKGSQVRYCSDCGKLMNPQARQNPNCARHHQEYGAQFGWCFCPDCGIELPPKEKDETRGR